MVPKALTVQETVVWSPQRALTKEPSSIPERALGPCSRRADSWTGGPQAGWATCSFPLMPRRAEALPGLGLHEGEEGMSLNAALA